VGEVGDEGGGGVVFSSRSGIDTKWCTEIVKTLIDQIAKSFFLI